ncbi:antibiotic biosynthesis monooxygenase [Vibrio profundum]|uniref:putative quinol monooxygenase n=1 Tax=Vibrio profundum TaxID=2910247 RepID=UPI003D105B27
MIQVNKAILGKIEVKPEYSDDMEALLKSLIEIANQESGTITWFAFKISDTHFGIFDTFVNKEGRQRHLNGDIVKTLLSTADTWFSKAPDISMADVLAAKLN